MYLKCVQCSKIYTPKMLYSCKECDGILEVVVERNNNHPVGNELKDSMWRYGNRLSVNNADNIVSLQEGRTPIHKGKNIKSELDDFEGKIFIKDETMNPTGSFKDRLISVAISKAKELGYKKVVCSSSGNAGAATAAYAAKAGLEAVVLAPKSTPREKMTQIASYGAKVIFVEGNYSNSYKLAEMLSKNFGYFNLTTTFINPFGVDALKTISYELNEQLHGKIPDFILVPVGSGPLLKGLYQGYLDIINQSRHPYRTIPRLVAVQAEGCSPIVKAYRLGTEYVVAWEEPSTVASGISDPLKGYEKDGAYTLSLVRKSKGFAISVNDLEIKAAMKTLAHTEGIFTEPTGASPLAALKKMLNEDLINSNCNVVCLVTGHGFKDMNEHFNMIGQLNYLDDPNNFESVSEVLSLKKSTYRES
ncbi:threonine synthase [Virgibacillus doumboii]|uniref:threonine synthase n=1 Tax=Virgibacillus doumboii TaxID=2697503 RepID=UPI0013E0BA36|nr:threonine synthase [Virgibacillus doumboii]